VKTCLLLAALAGDGPSRLLEPELSRDHSERMLASMGVDIQVEGNRVTLVPPSPLQLTPLRMNLPGDISSAAFLMVAAAITPGSQIVLQDILLNPTRTGLLDAHSRWALILRSSLYGSEMGSQPVMFVCHIAAKASKWMAVSCAHDRRVPAFAIAAAFAHGRTQVHGAAELRHKESDRISALCQELSALGVDIAEAPDGFTIQGGSGLRGGLVVPSGDHRLAMTLAIAGLASNQPMAIQDAEIIAESFPNFPDALRSLGAEVRLEV
jgi:3-phosphoshikimate 1-carboxyvinyltransferase